MDPGVWVQVRTLPGGPAVLLRVGGEIDGVTAVVVEGGVDQALAEASAVGASLLVVEVDEVTFCASPGITVLFHARRRARQQGLAFAVAARPDGPVRRVLSLTQMDQALQAYDTLEHALSASPRS